jgi:hypothetical protein
VAGSCSQPSGFLIDDVTPFPSPVEAEDACSWVALESAHVNSGSKTTGDSPLDSARLLADLQAVDAKVARAVDMINASLTAGNGDGDKR